MSVRIGEGTWIGGNTWIDCVYCKNMVSIGRDVVISGHSYFVAHDPFEAVDGKPIIVEDHAFIGLGAIILYNVRIGHHAVVGAGSVVTRDIPPYAIAAGSPAKVVRHRHTSDTLLRVDPPKDVFSS